MDPLLARIKIDPAVCHGKPCIRGLRDPVEAMLDLPGAGMTADEILADHEDLEPDDLRAVLPFAVPHCDEQGVASMSRRGPSAD